LGEDGGVGSAKEKGFNSGSGSWMTGTSALGLGVVPDDEKEGNGRSSSLGRDGEDGECTNGICWNERKSEEPALEDLSRGRLTSRPEVFGLSVIGDLKSALKVVAEWRCIGDNGAGGLLHGRLAGLNGMWKYGVRLGRSTVETGASVLTRVGGWYVMPIALCKPLA
jgi:hypothetical protein